MMISFGEAQRLVRTVDDVAIERLAVAYGHEVIVSEIGVEPEVLDGPRRFVINVDAMSVHQLGSAPSTWPAWFLDDLESEITLL